MAVAGDIAAVLALEKGIAEAPHWSESDYAVILSGEGLRRCLLIAELGGEIAGFAVSKLIHAESETLAELESVVVRSTMRRRGIGQALCHAVGEWCRAQGATELELEVRAGNAGAVGLYRRLGFEPTGLRRAYYREPVEDALLMRLKLI